MDGGGERKDRIEDQPGKVALRTREYGGGAEPVMDGIDDGRQVKGDSDGEDERGAALRDPQPGFGAGAHSRPRNAARRVARFSPAIEAEGSSALGQRKVQLWWL